MSNSIIFKTFRTYAHPYVYDRHTNAVVMLTDDEYKELVAVEKGELAAENSTVIKRYQEQGLFVPNVVQKIEHSGTSRLEPYLKTRMKQLTLQVTQQCNLRCEYCAYSGIYDKNRIHNSSRMSFDTAKKAIDYFLLHSTDMHEVYIGFYGGEPLLEFDLIKKCVEYADSLVEGQIIHYNMTTNGTLLNDIVVDYLVEHDISISISLDGSKNEHDINRKFRNGSGSFDVIIANIKRIRERYPEYDKKIQIMTTINPHMDLKCVLEYFNTDEVLSDKNILFNAMNERDLKTEISYNEDYYRLRNYEYIKCLFYITGKLDRRYVSALTISSIGNVKNLINRIHEHAALPIYAHHNGPCMPGVRKLFVSTDGKFYPCERVNELQHYFCIGSVEDGVDLKQSRRLLNIGEVTATQCRECWALRQCSLCAGQIEFEDEPTPNDKLKSCRMSKRQTLNGLYELCVLSEFGIAADEMGGYV